ncbi:hypothetical protein EZS27_000760, partial [termite gut metagenome]
MNITLNGVSITNPGGNNSPLQLGSGAKVTLKINGTNTLTASGLGAGIYVPTGSELTITGDNLTNKLTAQGGTLSENGGAGIGSKGTNTAERNVGTIIIEGSVEIVTQGGTRAAGIGSGGINDNKDNYTGNIIINGNAKVTATGGGYGAGIGTGADATNNGTITINGGTVNATGGSATWGGGAGIGSGTGSTTGANIINISGGTITATAGNGGGGYGNAGIGGESNNSTINISGGTITATRRETNYHDIRGVINISGGSVKLTDGTINGTVTNGASIPVFLSTLTLSGISTATAVTAGNINSIPCTTGTPSGGNYGIKDVKTDDAGKVYFWLPEASSKEKVSLTAGSVYSNSFTRNNNNNNTATLCLPPVIITAPSMPDATVNAAYDQTLAIDISFPATWSVSSGSLPAGLSINSSTGAITGTPTTAATGGVNFTVLAVTDAGDATKEMSIKVQKGTLVITWDTTVPAITYGDVAPVGSLNATTTGTGVVLSYSSSNEAVATVSGDGSNLTITGAGTATITASTAEDANYAAATTVEKTLTINKKTLSSLTWSNTTLTYNGAAQAPTATVVTANGLVGSDELTVTVTGDQTDFSSSPYTATATGFGGAAKNNYNLPSTTTTNFTIGKKELTVTGLAFGEKTYDGTTVATPSGTPELSGVVNSDDVTLNANGVSFAFSSKNVGTTNITRSGNYALAGGKAGNYSLTQPSSTFTGSIAKKAITITANNQSDVTYGVTVTPGYTTSIPPFSGDSFTGALSISGTPSGAGRLVAGSHSIEIGSLAISDGNSGGNYDVSFTGDDFTVNPLELTHNVTVTATKEYDGTNTAEHTGNLTNVISGDAVTLSVALQYTAGKNVQNDGAISASTWSIIGNDIGNYSLPTFPTAQTAIITAKPITITANNQGDVTYGEAVTPDYTTNFNVASIGDNFTGALSIDGERSTSDNLKVGSHNIVRGSLAISDGNNGGNYDVSFTGDG